MVGDCWSMDDSIGCCGPLPGVRQTVPRAKLFAVYALLMLCHEAPATWWTDHYN